MVKAAGKTRQKSSSGPFKGPTPKGVFQTVDLGSGSEAGYLFYRAKRFPSRLYLAVDYYVDPKGLPKNLKRSKEATRVLHNIAAQGKKVRHIQISMPSDSLLNLDQMGNIARLAARVLLPNGKVHFLCPHSPVSFFQVAKEFKAAGFSVRIVPRGRHVFFKYSPKAEAWFEEYRAIPWEYEFTFRLKKAVPNKEKRRAWPRE